MSINLDKIDVIGVHGPLNGGKDTVASLLMELRPGTFTTYAFARPLKQAGKILFGFTDEQLEDRILKEAVDPFWGFTPRKAMQLLGTEFGRDMLRKDIWIKRAEREVEMNKARGLKTIITDVRFENEAEWIRSLGEKAGLIYLEVTNLVRDEKYNHASEAGITKAINDVTIQNDKTNGLQWLKHLVAKGCNIHYE
jgi:hypothetical protein